MLRRRAVLILSIFGHVHYLEASKKLGDTLLVIVNNDNFLKRKKGYVFMPLAVREKEGVFTTASLNVIVNFLS